MSGVHNSTLTNAGFSFSIVSASDITDDQLKQCATLFSANYGQWGIFDNLPAKMRGQRVKLSSKKLAEQCLGNPERSVLALCNSDDGLLIGQAFATTWDIPDGRTVGWITQLVVDRAHRRKRIAADLLQVIKRSPTFTDVTIFGVASSHPATCHTLAKLAYDHIADIDLSFIAANAKAVLEFTPVKYLQGAALHGTLFSTPNADIEGVVSSANTNYFIDHTVPLEVLEAFGRSSRGWPLGKLPDGHEFLVIVPRPSD